MAFDYATREFGARLTPQPGKKLTPEQPSKIVFSQEQKDAARAVFGSEDPIKVKRLPGKGPRALYSMTIPAHRYESDEMQAAWKDIAVNLSIGASGAMQATGSMAELQVKDIKGQFDVRGVKASGQRKSDALVGNYRVDIAKMAFGLPNGTNAFSFHNSRFAGDSKRQGKFVHMQTDFSVEQLKFDAVAVDRLHMGMRMRNLEAGALMEWKKAAEEFQARGESDPKAIAEFMGKFKNLFQRLMLRGASLDIDDISGQYRGNKVAMKMKLAMPNAVAADFDDAASVIKKLDGRIQVTVPLAVVRDVTRAITEAVNRGKEAPAQPVDKMASDMYEAVVGKMLANGFARMEKDALHTTIELKRGVLLVNDKAVPLESLLAILTKNDKLPPADTSKPVAITMRDRGLEAARLFALNRDSEGLYDLCERHLHGIDVQKDIAEAQKQCTKAKDMGSFEAVTLLAGLYLDGKYDGDFTPVFAQLEEIADTGASDLAQYQMYQLLTDGKASRKDPVKAMAYLRMAANEGNKQAIAALAKADPEAKVVRKPVTEDNPWVIELDAAGGHIAREYFRFDVRKHRHLRVSLGKFQPHKKWIPMMNVCLSALHPSDVACVRFNGIREEQAVGAYSEVMPPTGGEKRNSVELPVNFEEDAVIDLLVYVIGNQAYFVVGDEKPLVQKLDFPAETIELSCSTGACRFEFEPPDEQKQDKK